MSDSKLKYLLVTPALLVVALVSLWPLLQSLYLSLRTWRLTRTREPVGFVWHENYWRAITEEDAFWNAVFVTGLYTVATVVFSILLALGLALLLSPAGRLRSISRTLLVLPFAMSPALVGISFRFMFNPEFGLFDAFFSAMIPPLADVAWLSNPTLAFIVCVMSDVWGWTPFLTMVLLGGLAAIPRETIEASQVDGAGALRTFWQITLPQLGPAIAVAAILKTVFSLKTFDQIYMLTNGGPGTATQTLAHYAYFNGFKYYDMGYASAIAWVIALPMFVLAVMYARYVFKRD